MKPYDPNTFAHELPVAHRQFVQSVNDVLNSNVDMGTPQGNTPTNAGTYGINAGVYSQFKQGNGSGVLIRIAANGVVGTGATYNWGTTGTGVLINHGLLRQPIGFHVVDADKDVRVYRTAAPDQNQITLASTDNTSSVTVYVF
jgi:hypothetical protein